MDYEARATVRGVDTEAGHRPQRDGREGPSRGRRVARRALHVVLLGLAGLLVVMIVMAIIPADLKGLSTSQPAPTSSYAEAMARFEGLSRAETDRDVYEPCHSAVYGEPHRVAVAVVLLHGLTNCPRQFRGMAEQLAESGMNVVVLRAPQHGIATADGRAIGDAANARDLSADDLTRWADASVDIAEGLGRDVRVLGMSMGGATAAWLAQNRTVDRVVMVSPALTLHGLPGFLDRALRNLGPRLPHFAVPGPATVPHEYPGTTVGGAAQMFLLAAAVRRDAAREPPQTQDLVVVLNPDDTQIDNTDVLDLAADWRGQGADVRLVMLDLGVTLPHEVVDAAHPEARVDLTWPILIETLT